MAEDKPTLHIDTDWKKQAQEEKKRLAEQAAAHPKESLIAPAPTVSGQAPPRAGRDRAAHAPQALQATFASLVQAIMTQGLFSLGELPGGGGEPQINFDMARYQLDSLGILEQKTAGNLSEDEKKLLDTALYETRMRFVSV